MNFLQISIKFILTFAFCLCSILSSFSQKKTLGLTKKTNGNDENGYVLFAPIGVDTTYLINKCGQKIHSWKTESTPGLSSYIKPNGNLLRAGTYTDTVFGAAGGRGGLIEEYDWNGKLVWKYLLFNDSLCQHHDIFPMPNGNVLVLAWHSISKTEAINLGRDPFNFGLTPELWGERIIELKPIGKDSAEIVWQWDLFDHIVQDKDTIYPNYGIVAQHPELMDINYALNKKTFDWIHANSINYNEKLDQIVISAHNIGEIWIIDHSTTTSEAKTHLGGTFNKGGDFLYRWGNPQAYGQGTASDRKLFRQHDAKWIPNGYKDSGCIILFNNGWERDTAYSSIDIIKTPILPNGSYISAMPYGPYKAAWIYTDSVKTNFYSQIISGSEMLPNGNVLICSGVQGRFFEVTPQKKIVWEYRNPITSSTVQSDGQTPANNSVFRCSYYSKNYSAFTGKNLNSKGTIEKNSYPYSCNYETVKPKIIAFNPMKADTSVGLFYKFKLVFNEAVLKANGNIIIYQNNQFLESININSDLIKVFNDTVIFGHMKPFALNSRVAIHVPASVLRDSSNNLLEKGIDSSEWYFYTIKNGFSISSLSPPHQKIGVLPNQIIQIQFNKNAIPRNNTSIRIYENGILKETIPTISQKVNVNNNIVEITPSNNFKINALIVIEMDSCFADVTGMGMAVIPYSDWYFRVIDYPKQTALSPVHSSLSVSRNFSLSLTSNRPVTLDSIKPILIYENGILVQSLLPVKPSTISFSNTILLNPGRQFKEGARIAIKFPANAYKDSLGLYLQAIDSTAWNFTLEKSSSMQYVANAIQIEIYPVPNAGVFTLISNETIKTIEILDLNGKAVQFESIESDLNKVEITMNSAAKGMYFIRINNTTVRMVIIE